jgi:hypothetical protein
VQAERSAPKCLTTGFYFVVPQASFEGGLSPPLVTAVTT